MSTNQISYGINVGHGFVKATKNVAGVESSIVFPAMLAPASKGLYGSDREIPTVQFAGRHWWTGEDALYAGGQQTSLSQERLVDPEFIPVLVRGALQRLGVFDIAAASGLCVTGLPATWSKHEHLRKALGARLREATQLFTKVMVVAAPWG